MTDVVEAMARAYYEAIGHSEPWATLTPHQRNSYIAPMRSSVRAVHERGGLVVARMPGFILTEECDAAEYHDAAGWNRALAAVRAAAVEVEG